jgi:hypothetical protein
VSIGLGDYLLGRILVIPEFRCGRLLVEGSQFLFSGSDVKDTPASLPIYRAILSN